MSKYRTKCPECGGRAEAYRYAAPDGTSRRTVYCQDWCRGTFRSTVAPRRSRVPKAATLYAAGGAPGESNDCAVRALAVAACVDYGVAHAACSAHGRKPGRGTELHIIEAAARDLAPTARRVPWEDVRRGVDRQHTIASFAAAHPRGHFVVWSMTHALAVCDGIVHDWASRGVTACVQGAIRLDN